VAPQKGRRRPRRGGGCDAAATRARNVVGGFGTERAGGAPDPGECWVIARVMEIDVPRVEPGDEARFTPDAYEARSSRGGSTRRRATPIRRATPRRSACAWRTASGGSGPMTGAVALETGAAREADRAARAVVYDDARPLVFVESEGAP
jgi:hypothetical protein